MSERKRNILGYLAAFTFGVLCMGVIALFLLNSSRRAPQPELSPVRPQDEPVESQPVPSPRRQTFQRLPRNTSQRAEVPAVEPATEPSPAINASDQTDASALPP